MPCINTNSFGLTQPYGVVTVITAPLYRRGHVAQRMGVTSPRVTVLSAEAASPIGGRILAAWWAKPRDAQSLGGGIS